jgi:hypothetical protein
MAIHQFAVDATPNASPLLEIPRALVFRRSVFPLLRNQLDKTAGFLKDSTVIRINCTQPALVEPQFESVLFRKAFDFRFAMCSSNGQKRCKSCSKMAQYGIS